VADTEEERKRFRTDKTYFRDYCRGIHSEMIKPFYALLKDSTLHQGLYEASVALHKERLAITVTCAMNFHKCLKAISVLRPLDFRCACGKANVKFQDTAP
jgi:hypothetical protein